MEPVSGAGEFGANLQEPVIAGDVREFMSEHDAAAVFRPTFSAGWQHDDGAEDTPREGHGKRTAALQKTDRTVDFVELGDFRDGAPPRVVQERLGMRRNPS